MISILSLMLDRKTNQALSPQCRSFFKRANFLSIMETIDSMQFSGGFQTKKVAKHATFLSIQSSSKVLKNLPGKTNLFF
jgi:hypothetical protein